MGGEDETRAWRREGEAEGSAEREEGGREEIVEVREERVKSGAVIADVTDSGSDVMLSAEVSRRWR